MQVTVTGGSNHGSISLPFPNKAIVTTEASLLAASISSQFSDVPAQFLSPTQTGTNTGYLIALADAIGSATINGMGYQAITIRNTDKAATLIGGGSASGQMVLASNGGLTYSANVGAVTLVAAGGNNSIDFTGSNAADVVYTGGGNDSIKGGNLLTTINAGLGNDQITLGGGQSYDTVMGSDTVALGAGAETVNTYGTGSAFVRGAATVSVGAGGGQYSLTFIGGSSSASTVLSGAGSYSIQAGAGGGVFHGGKAGDNFIQGGSGNVTIYGRASGDTLQGGTSSTWIRAGTGNETLIAGQGFTRVTDSTVTGAQDTLTLDHNVLGNNSTVRVFDFTHGMDFIHLVNEGSSAQAYALDTFGTTNGGTNGFFLLPDQTRVILEGVTQLTNSDFK